MAYSRRVPGDGRLALLIGSLDHRRLRLVARTGPGVGPRLVRRIGRSDWGSWLFPARRHLADRRRCPPPPTLERPPSVEPTRRKRDRRPLRRRARCRSERRPGAVTGCRSDRATRRAPTGELICFLSSELEPLDPAWLDRLAAAIERPGRRRHPDARPSGAGLPAASPHDLLVRQAGLRIVPDRHGQPRLASERRRQPLPATVGPSPVSSAIAVPPRRPARRTSGSVGLVDAGGPGGGDRRPRLRLRHAGGVVVGVPDAHLVDRSPVPSVRSLTHPIEPIEPGLARGDRPARAGPASSRDGERQPDPHRTHHRRFARPDRRPVGGTGSWRTGWPGRWTASAW